MIAPADITATRMDYICEDSEETYHNVFREDLYYQIDIFNTLTIAGVEFQLIFQNGFPDASDLSCPNNTDLRFSTEAGGSDFIEYWRDWDEGDLVEDSIEKMAKTIPAVESLEDCKLVLRAIKENIAAAEKEFRFVLENIVETPPSEAVEGDDD